MVHRIRSVVTDVSFWADHAAVAGLVLLVVVFGFLSPSFLTTGNVAAIFSAAAVLVILAVAQAFVITTGGIDLSMAATVAVGAVVFGLSWQAGLPVPVSAVAAIAMTSLIGLTNGVVIAKGKVTDFIVTLGTLGVATGLALILSGGQPITVTSPELLRLTIGGVGPFGYPILVAVVIAVVAFLVMFRSRFGLHVQAVGGNAESAEANGVKSARVRITVYTIAGALAGLAAVLVVARIGAAQPTVNTTYLLNSIAAVVLGGVALTGGKGSVVGPVVGAILLTSLTNGLTLLSISQFYQPLAVGIVVVLAALLTRFQKR